jgi:hypothetical protein
VGTAFAVLSGLLAMIGLPTLPDQFRAWTRWAGWIRSDVGRWVLVVAGVGVGWVAVGLGTSPHVVFAALAGGVVGAIGLDQWARWQGRPGWTVECDWTPNRPQFLMWIVSEGELLSGLACAIRRRGDRDWLDSGYKDDAATVQARRVVPTDFPSLTLRRGWYQVRWTAKSNLIDDAVVRRFWFHVRRDGSTVCRYPRRIDVG